uniref:Uncharacterized protein n=1 Tax=Triticum urartu TaxID=4572 RepID=A0A8R7UIV7_TRIUA
GRGPRYTCPVPTHVSSPRSLLSLSTHSWRRQQGQGPHYPFPSFSLFSPPVSLAVADGRTTGDHGHSENGGDEKAQPLAQTREAARRWQQHFSPTRFRLRLRQMFLGFLRRLRGRPCCPP